MSRIKAEMYEKDGQWYWVYRSWGGGPFISPDDCAEDFRKWIKNV